MVSDHEVLAWAQNTRHNIASFKILIAAHERSRLMSLTTLVTIY